MSILNLHHLRYFWAVAHEDNLTRAAEKLHVSQSAVSIQIKKLEQALGHDLFERRGKRLVLTEAGRLTLDHADQIFSVAQELVGTLQETGREVAVLRVGSQATLSRNFQLRFLSPLFERDDVEIVVRSGPLSVLLRALEAHRIDVVLANRVPARDAATPWVAHTIAEQPLSIVGRRRYARSENPDAEELLRSERLLLPAADTGMRIALDAYLDRLGIYPRIAAEVDDMAMLRLLAREGLGVAVVPSIVVRDELDTGDLRELAQLPKLMETFHAITLKRRFPNPLVRELIRDSV